MASKRVIGFGLVLALCGCGPNEENSPDMGAVAPKPNFNAAAQAPNSIREKPAPNADAAAMGAMGKRH